MTDGVCYRPISDVCAAMTSLKAEYWMEHSEECLKIYVEKEDAFVSLCAFIVMLFGGYVAFKTALKWAAKIGS